MKEIKVLDIIRLLGDNYVFSKNIENMYFKNAKPIDESNIFSISWIRPSKDNQLELLNNSKSNIIVCSFENKYEKIFPEKLFIKVKNPKIVFLRIVKEFFVNKQKYGIHKSCIIDPSSKIHKDVYIGPNCVIGNVKIGSNVVIHENCSIGDNTVIGDSVRIKSNTVVGGDGFGYGLNEYGAREKFPHIGGVIIEDNVDIGSNTCIDKGALGNTIISTGTKIDNLVQIAHNVKIGKNSMIISKTVILGSVIIGDNTWISPSCSIKDGISIGSNVVIGLGSIVLKNVPDNEMWLGSPARRIKIFNKD